MTRPTNPDQLRLTNTDQRKIWPLVLGHLRWVFEERDGHVPEAEELTALLSLMRVREFEFEGSERDIEQAKAMLAQSVLAQPTQAGAAWGQIVGLMLSAASGQSGLPRVSLAQLLAVAGLSMLAAPSPSGSPLLVYKVCQSGCHLIVSGVDGSDPRAVPGSDEARDPTIWGDRVAWMRSANQVMTSLLDGSGRRTLGGAPRRLCQPANKVTRASCEATTNRSVTGLQLYYGRLALTDSFYTRNGDPNGEGEVLTEAVKGGPQHLIALRLTT